MHQAPFLSDGGGLVIDEIQDGGSPYRKIAAFSEIIGPLGQFGKCSEAYGRPCVHLEV